jgi:cell division transport system permease protein
MRRVIRGLLAGDARSDRVVPASGATAQLTLFVSGAMAFLAVFALSLAMTAGRVADHWSGDLAQTATLRIAAPGDQRADQTGVALVILEQTPGIASARALSVEEQAALLEPWLGADLPPDLLPLPQLIEIVAEESGYDVTALRARLAEALPEAVLDDHGQWRTPLVEAAQGLRRLALLSLLLICGTMAAMILLAARAALAANAQVIEVLRLVGAQDRFVARAFVRRFTFGALVGAGAGMALGMLAVALLPAAGEAGGFLADLGFRGAGWLVPLLIPALAGTVALAATWLAARQKLTELS